MVQTIHIDERLGRPKAEAIRLHDCLVAIVAMLVPEEAFDRESPEVHYLRSFGNLLTDAPPVARLEALEAAMDSPGLQDAGERDLIQLADTQQLSFAEIVALLLCFAVENNAMLGRCIAYLQKPLGGSRPTLSLLNALLGPFLKPKAPPVMAAIANTRAVDLGLLQIVDNSVPLPEQVVKMPPALGLCLATGDITWPGARVGIAQPAFDLPPSVLEAAQAQARALDAMPGGVLILRCPSALESTIAAEAIALYCGYRPLFVHDDKKALPAMGPLCQAKKLMPVFSYQCGPSERIQLPEIKGYAGGVLAVAGLEGAFESNRGSLSSWVIPRPSQSERKQLWDAYLNEPRLSARLAGDHVYSTARIVELATLARRRSISANRQTIDIDDVRQAAWLNESGGLASLAQPVTAVVGDDALVVRPFTRRQLALLEKRCHLREHLGEALGITIKARYQMGVKALFLGPSGTGKTLAASWLANRLGIPLYRVDLAAVTSKYIGETEKNLAQLLGRAEQDEVVLLFDEADAIFGKRTDIKDANDRFANAQTNYLLQRIETYSGVVILTSNSKSRFDAAFTRRLDMMIDFPLPNPEERRAIWLSHLGDYHELTRANLNQLAVQCNLTGGHIRNVVLSAAVSAKSRESKITFNDVIQALSDEYRKLGKQMGPELKRMITA